RVVWANQAAAEMLGATTPDAIVNASPGSVAAAYAMTGEDGRPISPDDLPSRRLLRGEDAPPLVIRAVERATGRARWTRTTARPLDMGSREPLAVNIIEDITAAKRAALRREALEAVGRLLDRADPTSPDTLAAICAVVSPVKADWCAIDLVDGDGELERVAIMHPDPELRRLGWELTRRYPAPPDAVADVLAGEPQLLAHIPVDADQTIARDDEHLELLRRLVLRSALRAPLSGGGRVHGILTLAHAESGRVFDEDDLAFAVDMGRRIGLAVAFARR
ncbi:MAG TPA: GAF domain-containing protein, partial [Capillimicrobium sp.]|nr:GAF domain-containing protein [Capillimicrobium sp.]